MSKLEKIEKAVIEGYQKIENGVVEGYKKIEEGAVEGFKKVRNNKKKNQIFNINEWHNDR